MRVARGVLFLLVAVVAAAVAGCQQGGVLVLAEGASDELRLFAPITLDEAYLVNRSGDLVRSWQLAAPAHAVYLLHSGNLLAAVRAEQDWFNGGGQAGRLQEIAPDGTVVWDYTIASADSLQHHDIEPLPNGNVLAIVWERIPREEALAAGRDPEQVPEEGVWSDVVMEIEPVRPASGRVVWRWRVWDHLVQDRAPDLPSWGAVADSPRRIDVNAGLEEERRLHEESPEELERLRALGYLGAGAGDGSGGAEGGSRGADWLHTNSVDYDPLSDQILLSVRNLSEIWIIDHSTTTEEAAGDSGGRYGHGGDLLYRFGNPVVTGGSAIDQRLYVQHDARWIDPGRPGAGNILLFNNGDGRPEGQYSTVEEMALPRTAAGDYELLAQGFAAPGAVWSFRGGREVELYSSRLSGAERLANGNTLICEGESGRFLEVTAEGKVVWEYLNPYRGAPGPPPGSGDRPPGPPPGGPPPGGDAGSAVFRVSAVDADRIER